jgi:TrfA protein.
MSTQTENIDTGTLKQLAGLEKKSAEQSLSKDILLPECPDAKRGTPNTFLRSALFSAVQSKDRIDRMDEAVLGSQNGITVMYSGQQLNQEDLTVWETLVHLAKDSPLGDVCKFSAYEILKSMGLDTGGCQHTRLHKTIIRLAGGVVQISVDGKLRYGSALLHSFVKDDATGHYAIQLNRKLINLYGQSDWTAIDWGQRLTLQRKPLAQALHGYYSSHKAPYPVTLSFLQRLSGSRNKQPAGFKTKVIAALNELVNIDFLESFVIENELVSVTKKRPKTNGFRDTN